MIGREKDKDDRKKGGQESKMIGCCDDQNGLSERLFLIKSLLEISAAAMYRL